MKFTPSGGVALKGSCEEKTNNKEADDDEDSSLPNKKAIEVQ
jgi:hypothetical protein